MLRKIKKTWLNCYFKTKKTLFLGVEDLNFLDYITKVEGGLPRSRQCKLCENIFYNSSTAVKHVENIHFPGQFQYSCQFCSEVFDRKNKLYQHVSKFHKS